LDSTPFGNDGETLMKDSKNLQNQSKSMAMVASCFSTTSQIQSAFLANKVEINNERLKKVKINNLKTTRELRVIIEK
jgi:hypothetical protein